MLTLFVLTCDNPKLDNPKKAIKSLGHSVSSVREIDHRNILLDIKKNKIETEWYGYIFSDEVLDEFAEEALPIYLNQGGFDSMIMMKKETVEGKPRITQAPRIFHKSISLKDNMFIPDNECKFERMLDGWILPNA